ncbi:MAG: DUF418 domain-containing protein [Betaproteobacteria bacterium]
MSAQQPTTLAERIEALDVMRGIALLGIFIMNMPGLSSSFFIPEAVMREKTAAHSEADAVVHLLSGVLLEGKFNGLFTLLFGMGLALQMQRLSAQGSEAVVWRRLAVLMGFGILHIAVLWGGDVLHIYAVLGVVLWAVRAWSARSLLMLALAMLLAQFVHGVLVAQLWRPEAHEAEQRFLQSLMTLDNAVFGSGPWWPGVALRLQESWWFYAHEFLWPSSSWFWLSLLCTAVLGLWVQRTAWLKADAAPARWMGSAAGLKGLTALLAVAVGLWMASSSLTADHDTSVAPTPQVLLGWMLGDTHRVLMVLAYAGLVLRWCLGARTPWLRRPLACVGRMPLTMYLMQSLMGAFIFQGWGLGYWDELGPTALTVLALLLYGCIQVPLASWWLSRHDLGPAEALWRRLSYGHPPNKP